jgi:hypothetical protein
MQVSVLMGVVVVVAAVAGVVGMVAAAVWVLRLVLVWGLVEVFGWQQPVRQVVAAVAVLLPHPMQPVRQVVAAVAVLLPHPMRVRLELGSELQRRSE